MAKRNNKRPLPTQANKNNNNNNQNNMGGNGGGKSCCKCKEIINTTQKFYINQSDIFGKIYMCEVCLDLGTETQNELRFTDDKPAIFGNRGTTVFVEGELPEGDERKPDAYNKVTLTVGELKDFVEYDEEEEEGNEDDEDEVVDEINSDDSLRSSTGVQYVVIELSEKPDHWVARSTPGAKQMTISNEKAIQWRKNWLKHRDAQIAESPQSKKKTGSTKR